MDTERIDRLGTRPLRPLVQAVAGLRDVRDLAAFLGEFERLGGHGLFGSYVDTDDRKSDRYLFHITQGGLGLPDESYYRDDKFAEVRDKYVEYLERLLELGGHEDPSAAAATVLALDTRIAKGHWERAETRDVQKTYNLLTAGDLAELCPNFDWAAYVTNLGGTDETIAEVCVRQPSYLEHLSKVLDEMPIEDWRDWLLSHVLRAAAPYLPDDFVETNFDFYGRTLNGTPELRARWKRGVSLVEGALGEAVGKEYVARHFPPSSKAQMDELVANLLAAYRESISRAGLDDRGDQAAGLREARHVPAEDRLPREVPRLLRAAHRHDRPDGQRGRGLAVRDRPAAAQDRLTRSTATSGSCCRRPSTPTTTPAPTRSASPRASCRSRSSPRTPTRPRTTAASAR